MIRTFVYFLSVISFWGCVQTLKTSNNILKKDSIVANKPLALQHDKFRTKFDQGIDFIASGKTPQNKKENGLLTPYDFATKALSS